MKTIVMQTTRNCKLMDAIAKKCVNEQITIKNSRFSGYVIIKLPNTVNLFDLYKVFKETGMVGEFINVKVKGSDRYTVKRNDCIESVKTYRYYPEHIINSAYIEEGFEVIA